MIPRSSALDPERSSPCGEQYSTATMTNDQGLFTKIKESSLSISLTAALILVASIVVIISSITIQSAYMWLAVGATAVLFLGFCSCTTCEKTSHFHFRRGSIHSDSVSTISDGRDNFYEVGHLQNTPPYWIADLPPSYAVATATSMAPDCQLPPPYSAVADVHAPLRVYSDLNKPASGGESTYIDAPPPPPPLASPAPAHAPPPAPAAADTAVAVDCDASGSPLHVPSGDARPPTQYRSVGTRTATSVGTDTMHPANCHCDACSPC